MEFSMGGGEGVQDGPNIAYVIYEQPLTLYGVRYTFILILTLFLQVDLSCNLIFTLAKRIHCIIVYICQCLFRKK